MLGEDFGIYIIVDEDGDTYGRYNTRLDAERAIENLYEDPFVDSDKVFGIELG